MTILQWASLASGLIFIGAAQAQAPQAAKDGLYFPTAVAQTETDEYTRYELLAPETSSFKIYYEVTATTAGAKFFYNPIRKGSAASDESVYDAMRGAPLHFEVVSGAPGTNRSVDARCGFRHSVHQSHTAAAGPSAWPRPRGDRQNI
jgi:hypothetical protein